MSSLPSIDLDIAERLRANADFRQAYFLAESSAMIARQIIGLRKRRGLSQTDVANQLNTGQPAISRVESADYRNWSFNTLRRLAQAMDARIRISIEASEDVLGEYEKPAAVEEKTSLFASHFNQWLTASTSGAHFPNALARRSLFEEARPSAATSNDQLSQQTMLGLFAEPLERQRSSQKIGSQITIGATCS